HFGESKVADRCGGSAGFSHRAPGVEAALRGFEFGKAAALLLEEIILHTADALDGGENFLPRRNAFAEEHAIGLLVLFLAGRPILEMHALDSPGVCLDPRDRIGARLDAGADVELEDELRRRVRRNQVHYP